MNIFARALVKTTQHFKVRAFTTLVLTAGTIGFASPVFAQNFSFSNVSVEGNQRIETATILTYLGFELGEGVSAGQLNDAAQRIRATGLFESVNVVPQGGSLVIEVSEFPTVNRITFEGNSRLRDAELETVVRSQPRRVYSPAQAEEDTAAITQVYAEQGRINATVAPRIIELSDNRVDLVFEVFEGGLTEVERISFVGNRSFGESRLRRVLETKEAGLFRAIIGRDTFIADRVAFDQQVLTDFYQSRGYVDFQVQNVDVSLTRERDAYLITFNVQEGQRFDFGNITVSSEVTGADPLDYENALKLRSGVTYSPALIEQDIARLERLAINQGLNFVRVDPRITRNDRDQTLDVEFVLVNGPRIFVERIDIEGNNTTLDRVIRSRFDVVEGDPFNPRQIRESAERIRALGYFDNADVDAREGSSPDQVVIDVDVVEGPTGSLSFGGNFSTDNGVSLLARFSQSNFLGRGQALSFGIVAGVEDQSLNFSFTEPRVLGRDLSFGIDTSFSSSDSDDTTFDTTTARFRPRIGFPVSENGRLTLFYSYEYTDIVDIDADSSALIVADEGDVGTHALGYSYSYDTRRTGLNPNAGILFRFGQEFGTGDATYIETTTELTGQTTVLNDEVTLTATFEGGYLNYSSGNSRITDRYFLGSTVMRGFEPGGIGPRSTDLVGGVSSNDALGGNAFAVVRLEAAFPLGLPEEYGIRGGLFLDYGSVWDTGINSTDIIDDDFTPRTIAGVTVFWDTPVGPLRFNWTEPLDVQPNDETKTFDVTISTSF